MSFEKPPDSPATWPLPVAQPVEELIFIPRAGNFRVSQSDGRQRMSIAAADSNLPPLLRQIAGVGVCARQHMSVARFNRWENIRGNHSKSSRSRVPARLEETRD